jgi:hypothetical protein
MGSCFYIVSVIHFRFSNSVPYCFRFLLSFTISDNSKTCTKNIGNFASFSQTFSFLLQFSTESVRHVTGTGSGLLGGIPRVVVQMSALTLKVPL